MPQLRIIYPLFIFAALPLGHAANKVTATTNSEVTEIQKIYQDCLMVRKQSKNPIHLREIGDDPKKPSSWQRSQPNADDASDTAEMIKKDKKVKFLKLENSISSGDWNLVTEYCYRDTGDIAFQFSNLRTFHGDVRVETRIYYDNQGHAIRTLENISDLKTDKKMDPNDGRAFGFERQSAPELKNQLSLEKFFGRVN